jgi:hypothetical protein
MSDTMRRIGVILGAIAVLIILRWLFPEYRPEPQRRSMFQIAMIVILTVIGTILVLAASDRPSVHHAPARTFDTVSVKGRLL